MDPLIEILEEEKRKLGLQNREVKLELGNKNIMESNLGRLTLTLDTSKVKDIYSSRIPIRHELYHLKYDINNGMKHNLVMNFILDIPAEIYVFTGLNIRKYL